MARTLIALARGALPAVAVATLFPLALFYAALVAGSVYWAIAVSAAYAYGVAAWQYTRRRRVSGMLMVTVFMATMRAVGSLASGEPRVFFAVPLLETAGFGLMFAATMWSSEPLVVRLARDLVPHAADGLAERPSLTRKLSLVWTVTYVASCITSLVLLATVPLPVFIGAHTFTGWFWTGSGMALTVRLCHRRIGLLAGLERERSVAVPADGERPLAVAGP